MIWLTPALTLAKVWAKSGALCMYIQELTHDPRPRPYRHRTSATLLIEPYLLLIQLSRRAILPHPNRKPQYVGSDYADLSQICRIRTRPMHWSGSVRDSPRHCNVAVLWQRQVSRNSVRPIWASVSAGFPFTPAQLWLAKIAGAKRT